MARYVDVYDLNNNFRGELCNHIDCDNCTFHRGAYFCRLGDYLLKYETADVAPVIHAHKIHAHSQGGGTHWLVCSNCEKPVDLADAFCKHCGAKMDEEVNNG